MMCKASALCYNSLSKCRSDSTAKGNVRNRVTVRFLLGESDNSIFH